MRKGSMTVFAALTLALITGFLFALLEAARITELYKMADLNTASVMESLFAGYEVPLWERYHLLGWNGGGERESSRLAEKEVLLESWSDYNLGGSNLVRMEVSQVLLSDDRRITDGNGKVFIAAVASYMRNNLGIEAAKELYGQFEALQAIENADTYGGDSVEEAVEALEQAEKETASSETAGEEATEGKSLSDEERRRVNEKLQQNPLEEAQHVQKGIILSMVLDADEEVSGKSLELSKVVSHRSCCVGSSKKTAETAWEDRIYLQQYVTGYFSSYTTPRNEQTGLRYEQEYLLCGKSSDKENLSAVAGRLLAIREVANIAYLLTDAGKMAEAELIALALAGHSLNPVIVEVVKAGILAAWAFAESVLDVRALLQGQKVAVIKNAGQWTSDIYALGSCLSGTLQAKPCSNGLSYDTYLGLFLFTPDTQTVACRAMDLQEVAIQNTEGCEDFQMDHMIVEASADITYRYSPLFYHWGKGVFMQTGSYAYGKAGV